MKRTDTTLLFLKVLYPSNIEILLITKILFTITC